MFTKKLNSFATLEPHTKNEGRLEKNHINGFICSNKIVEGSITYFKEENRKTKERSKKVIFYLFFSQQATLYSLLLQI